MWSSVATATQQNRIDKEDDVFEFVLFVFISANKMSSRSENLLQSSQDSAKDSAADEFEQTKPGKGAKTSTYYRTNNIPERFDNPDCFQGYNTKKPNPMYMTSAMEYGRHPPTVHTMPTSFNAKCQKFSEHLGKCGMYRDQGLNTAMDKSNIVD